MIDLNILYILGIIFIVLGLVFAISYLRRKNIVNADDLKIVSNLLNLSVSIIQEMNLNKEPEILKISNIIALSLDNTIEIIKLRDKEKIIEQTKIFAYGLCEKNNIELTENRKEIIIQLIVLAFSTKYGDILVQE